MGYGFKLWGCELGRGKCILVRQCALTAHTKPWFKKPHRNFATVQLTFGEALRFRVDWVDECEAQVSIETVVVGCGHLWRVAVADEVQLTK